MWQTVLSIQLIVTIFLQTHHCVT